MEGPVAIQPEECAIARPQELSNASLSVKLATLIPAWNQGAQCALPEEPWFRFLHTCYLGAQNKYDEWGSHMGSAEKPYPFGKESYDSESVTTNTVVGVVNRNRLTFMIGTGKEDGDMTAFTNLRLRCPSNPSFHPDDMYDLEHEMGGMRFDKAHKDTVGTCITTHDSSGTVLIPNLWAFQEGRAFPLQAHHASNLNLTLSPRFQGGDIELTYDIVTIKGVPAMKHCDFPICMWQFTGLEQCDVPQAETGRYAIKCNFNHPLLNLNMRTEHPIQAARLVLNKHLEIPFQKDDQTGLWSIDFTPFQGGAIGDLTTSLNASRVDHLMIQMECAEGTSPGLVSHWAHTFNIARVMLGMAGLAFSK